MTNVTTIGGQDLSNTSAKDTSLRQLCLDTLRKLDSGEIQESSPSVLIVQIDYKENNENMLLAKTFVVGAETSYHFLGLTQHVVTNWFEHD